MSIFKTFKKIVTDPIKDQFINSSQRFSEADRKYKGTERVVAKANAAIGGITSPLAPVIAPLQKGVEKGMEVIDNTGKAIAEKIGDRLSPEQKEALRSKIAPKLEGKGADAVANTLNKIMESPYTEAGINLVGSLIGAKGVSKATKGAPKSNYVAIYNPEGQLMNPRAVTPSKIFKAKNNSNPTYNEYAKGTAFGKRNLKTLDDKINRDKSATAEKQQIFKNKEGIKNLDETYSKIKNDPTRTKEVPEYEMVDPGRYDPFDNVTRPAEYDIVGSYRVPKTTLDYAKEILSKAKNKNTPLIDMPFDAAYARARYGNSIPMKVLPKWDRFFRENPRMYKLFKEGDVIYDPKTNSLLDRPTDFADLVGETGR